MKKLLIYISVFLCATPISSATGQDTLTITLGEAIRRSVSVSVESVVSRNEFVSSYWEYRTYKAELLPTMSISGTLPYYTKTYRASQRDDGTFSYTSNHYNRIDAGLSISQNIPLTGGVLSIESSLQRLHQYGDNDNTSFKSVPASITLEQPIFGFNRMKWLKKIEPVKYKEAEKKLVSKTEDISNDAITYYFNLLLGQISMEIAQQNLANNERMYMIAEARRKIGQISENELLQLKVSLLKSESAMTTAKASYDARMFELRSFLGYGENIILKPAVPDFPVEDIPMLSFPEVLDLARQNNYFTQNAQRRILEASRSVSQAKADRWNARLFVSFGVSGQQNTFSEVFERNNWKGDREINVGIKIPILDWGKSKGRVKVAKANREVINSKVEKEQIDFNQNIFLQVNNFNNQSRQLELSRETDIIAQKRYKTSVEAFILGKIDVLNLNDSQITKDEARKNHISQMYWLWSYYYQIRSLTLYDFIDKKEITFDYGSIID